MEKKTPRELRGDRFTVAHLADYLGIHKSSYSRKERGEVRFTLEEAMKLADLYGVQIEAIDFRAQDVAEHATASE